MTAGSAHEVDVIFSAIQSGDQFGRVSLISWLICYLGPFTVSSLLVAMQIQPLCHSEYVELYETDADLRPELKKLKKGQLTE